MCSERRYNVCVVWCAAVVSDGLLAGDGGAADSTSISFPAC